jgi:hypothetical protein
MEFAPDSPFNDEDDDEWYRDVCSGNYPLREPVRTQRQRRQYGHGIDAQRTAPFRRYPMERSPIYRHLRQTSGIVTKELLMSVVTGVLRQSPPDHTPPQPTRSQKRAKAGLVAWLDDNSPFVLSYLRSRSSASE